MKVTNKGAAPYITDRKRFDANSMSGRWESRYCGRGWGAQCVQDYLDISIDRNRDGDGIYIVYSYATPIAWYDPTTDLWFYIDQNHSVTTTRHQTITRMAIDQYNRETGWQNNYVTVTP